MSLSLPVILFGVLGVGVSFVVRKLGGTVLQVGQQVPLFLSFSSSSLIPSPINSLSLSLSLSIYLSVTSILMAL